MKRGIFIGLCAGGIFLIAAAAFGIIAAAIVLNGRPSHVFSLFGYMAAVGAVITIGSGLCISQRIKPAGYKSGRRD